MELHGKNIVGHERSAEGTVTFRALAPGRDQPLDPQFHEATDAEVHAAFERAAEAFATCRRRRVDFAPFLECIAGEIEALGDALITRAAEETGLPEARLLGERGRTVGQLRMFAKVVRKGSWVDARIDHAIPDRKPIPKPDVRRMLIGIGPVAIFGASNFPLAFSVAGGDTASAIAAGNPVVVKAHPAHPGTSELVGRAIRRAAMAAEMPSGMFSLLHGTSERVGLAMVRHPLARAVGFTGSLRGGRALFDAANARPDPIPVYAEMGSINPVFLLPGALAGRADAIAEGLAQSVSLGVGQFCTNPGVVVGVAGDDLDRLTSTLRERIEETAPGTMLHRGILEAYERDLQELDGSSVVTLEARSRETPRRERTEAACCLLSTEAGDFLADRRLSREIFGPSTILVRARSREQLEAIAAGLEGHLTATIHGTEEDLEEHASLVSILESKVGRIIFNGFPTGVEVCPSMHHGGPYPATTNSLFTSVGTAAILRFARPVCYQGFPDAALPAELQDENPRRIWRLVDGELTRE